MPRKKDKKRIVTEDQKERMVKAMASFQKMKEELKPFTKKRGNTRYTTRGKWCDAQCI